VAALQAVLLEGVVWSAAARADPRLRPGRPNRWNIRVDRGRRWRRLDHYFSSSAGQPRTIVSSAPSPATGLPQKAQKFVSAGSGCPQCEQVRMGGAVFEGRPQFEQKCDPGRSGAPQRHVGSARMPRGAAATAIRKPSSSCMRSSMLSTSFARARSRSGLKRSRRTISTASPPTSRISVSRRRARRRRSRRIREGGGTRPVGFVPSAASGGGPKAGASGPGSPRGGRRGLLTQGMWAPSLTVRC